MGKVEPIFSFEIGGFDFIIGKAIIIQWAIILILGIGAYLLTRNLKREPTKKQVVLETLYTTVYDLVESNMGKEYISYLPYIGTLFVYLLFMNLTGLVGIEPSTSNLSVTCGLAVSTFLVINVNALKKNGVVGYTKAFFKPFILFLPLNLMERIIVPFSLAMRLFGNMVAGALLIELLYEGLFHIGNMVGLGEMGAIFGIGFPIVAHGFFDIFDGAIQMIVFTMITMINIKVTAEHH